MKAGVAIMIQLMKELLRDHSTNKKVMLMLTSDEEVSGEDGVEYLVGEGW